MTNRSVVFEAISFYNAYISLERANIESGGVFLLTPTVVNGAFSVEITLKAILINEGIPFNKEHNLVVLFELLPKAIQQMIWTRVAEKTPEYAVEEKRTAEFILISDIFKQWRYVYEDEVPAFNIRFLSSFANAAICVMFSLGYNVCLVDSDSNKSIDEIDQMIEDNRMRLIAENLKYISKKVNG